MTLDVAKAGWATIANKVVLAKQLPYPNSRFTVHSPHIGSGYR